MVNYAVKKGIPKIFMLDDDITRLDISLWDEQKRIVRASGTVLGDPEDWRKVFTLWGSLWKDEALFGASYRPFSWNIKKEWFGTARRSQLQAAVGVNIAKIHSKGLNYQSNDVVGNEDLFLQLECYINGLECTRTTMIQYDCPPMGFGEGGCNSSELGTIKKRQKDRVAAFYRSCPDKRLIRAATTRSGIKSVKFVWKYISEAMENKEERK